MIYSRDGTRILGKWWYTAVFLTKWCYKRDLCFQRLPIYLSLQWQVHIWSSIVFGGNIRVDSNTRLLLGDLLIMRNHKKRTCTWPWCDKIMIVDVLFNILFLLLMGWVTYLFEGYRFLQSVNVLLFIMF